ncbi:hypothetical protein KI387_018611, partial [Taxus chinensis]
MPPTMIRRRFCVSSPWIAGIILLWVLVVFAFPLLLFKFVFHFHSPYFYIAYASVLLLVTYVAFSEKGTADSLPPPERLPATSASRQTVDVDMPVFNYRRFKDEVEDGSGQQCVICLCNYEEEGEEAAGVAVSLPSCRHNFHVECIQRWLQCHGRCPICSASPLTLPLQPSSHPQVDVVSVSVLVDPPLTLAESHIMTGNIVEQ